MLWQKLPRNYIHGLCLVVFRCGLAKAVLFKVVQVSPVWRHIHGGTTAEGNNSYRLPLSHRDIKTRTSWFVASCIRTFANMFQETGARDSIIVTEWNILVSKQLIDLLHKSHTAPVPYPTRHQSHIPQCTCAHLVHCRTLRESIPRLFNWGSTAMTARCAPACSQILPVKPQGVWTRGIEAWAWSRDRRKVAEVGVFRALQPNDISV